MARYRMDDGAILDTDKAAQSWSEATWWNGSNHISVPTGSQWEHEKLYRSSRGRYYLEAWSDHQGTAASATLLDGTDAAATWLLANGHELPGDLAAHGADILE